MWNITVRSPDTRPIEYTLKPGTNTIGRRRDNDVVIPDQAASRAHAEFIVDEKTGTLTIRDLGSR
ncbi:MAG: FHA domain-containing protein, partial [Anaerolineales bacterium]